MHQRHGVVAFALLWSCATASSCCRWTPGESCASPTQGCTYLHEGLEDRTTTHEFTDANACLGGIDQSKWRSSFDGTTANVTLSYDATAVAEFATPLKVTHAASCATEAPTLTLQLDTVALGSLTVGGFGVAAALTALGCTPPSDCVLPPPSPLAPPPSLPPSLYMYMGMNVATSFRGGGLTFELAHCYFTDFRTYGSTMSARLDCEAMCDATPNCFAYHYNPKRCKLFIPNVVPSICADIPHSIHVAGAAFVSRSTPVHARHKFSTCGQIKIGGAGSLTGRTYRKCTAPADDFYNVYPQNVSDYCDQGHDCS